MWVDMDILLLWLTAIWLLCAGKTFGTVVSSDPAIACMLDDDHTNDELERCLKKGSDYIKAYMVYLKPGRRKKEFDRCLSFTEFDDCLTPLLDKCPSFRAKLHSHWRNLYDTMRCACSTGSDLACLNTVQCYEEEQQGLLARRCDAMFKFNIRQNTKEKCYFLNENVRCKEALVTSSCGEEAGLLTFHMAKLASKLTSRKHSCSLERTVFNYTGFRYTDQCPANFTAHLSQCKAQFLSEASLLFYEDNDLVADAKKKDVRQACKHYRHYRGCLAPIEDKCREGIDTLFSYDGGLRTYLLKMEYICNEAKKEYMNNLGCYRKVLQNETLSQCTYLWRELSPMLEEVTAHQYYCLPHEENSKKLNRTLVQLRNCYETVFTKACGEGGVAIGGLMTKAFQDPFYLRYKYIPDCSLHGTTTTTTATSAIQTSHGARDTRDKVTTSKPQRKNTKPERSKPSHRRNENQVVDSKPASYKSHSSSRIGSCPLVLFSVALSLYRFCVHNR